MENVINGYYKLSWRERIGFCSGDLAQNLIYQTVSIWLLFYYNNVYGLDSAVVAVMFLVVRIIDVIWDPMVGAFIDKSHPRWGNLHIHEGGHGSWRCNPRSGSCLGRIQGG